MQQDNIQDTTQHELNDTQEIDAMSHGTETGDATTPKSNSHSVEAPLVNRIVDVNGGIDDDNLLEMMVTDVQAMHTHTATDLSLPGSYGIREEKC